MFAPLDVRGRPLPPAPPLAYRTAVRPVSPGRQVRGRCRIHQASSVSGRRALSATILTKRPSLRLRQGTLLSCAETRFDLEGTPLTASVLINARHADELGRLPGMRQQPYSAGMVIADGRITGPKSPGPASEVTTALQPITARRVGSAWLAVQGGTTRDRLRALRALRTGS